MQNDILARTTLILLFWVGCKLQKASILSEAPLTLAVTDNTLSSASGSVTVSWQSPFSGDTTVTVSGGVAAGVIVERSHDTAGEMRQTVVPRAAFTAGQSRVAVLILSSTSWARGYVDLSVPLGFVVSGTVTGLSAGTSVEVQLNGQENLTVMANGAFSFQTELPDQSTYAVTVSGSPTGEVCVVSNGSGTISGSAVNDVQVVCSQLGPPRIFFTDLIAGPNTGGKDDNGAFISIYGKGFGTTQTAGSRVTIGGVEVASYTLWGQNNAPARLLDEIVVQPGAGVPSGAQDLVISVAGISSNAVPFAIRSGNIYFVDHGALDSNDGSFGSPFQSIPKAMSVMVPSDITYIRGGTYPETNSCGPGCDGPHLRPEANDTAYIGYPGELPVLGDTASTSSYGIQFGVAYAPEVFANLSIGHVANASVEGASGSGIRFVANQFDDVTAVEIDGATNGLEFLGNHLKDASLLFSNETDQLEFAYNEMVAMDFEMALASPLGLTGSVHHNLFEGGEFVFATNHTSQVDIYNNVFSQTSHPAMTLASVGATLHLYFNVFFDDAPEAIDVRAVTTSCAVVVSDNIFSQSGSEMAFENAGAQAMFSGSNNLWLGSAPAFDTMPLFGDPLFANPFANDFELAPNSPALNAGVDVGVATDWVGQPRPADSLPDVGIYEYN